MVARISPRHVDVVIATAATAAAAGITITVRGRHDIVAVVVIATTSAAGVIPTHHALHSLGNNYGIYLFHMAG